MATSFSAKKILIFIIINMLIGTGFCQSNITFGLIVGSGLPNLSIGYISPNWSLGGVTVLKPISIGVYGQYSVSKRFKTGLDLTYYRLPIRVSDNVGKPVFREMFNYLNLSPYVAYEPIKWVSLAFNLSIRPLLNYSPKEFSPGTALLSYYGPRLTIKPIKQLGIDFGYETCNRSFAIAHVLGDPAFLSNSMAYANIRFTPFAK